MASQNVADYPPERSREWGARRSSVFALPSECINGILAAWGRADNNSVFIQSRHEEMSAFDAVGYAKFSGRIDACMATSGHGAVHLLNGLYDANSITSPPWPSSGRPTARRWAVLPCRKSTCSACSRTPPATT